MTKIATTETRSQGPKIIIWPKYKDYPIFLPWIACLVCHQFGQSMPPIAFQAPAHQAACLY